MQKEHVAARLFTGLRWGVGLVTAVVALSGVTLLSIGIGFLAKALTNSVDHPVFARINRAGTNDWTDVLATLTKMGNVPQTDRKSVV